MTHIAVKFPPLPNAELRPAEFAAVAPTVHDPLRLEAWLSDHSGRLWRRRLERGAHLFLEGAETEQLHVLVAGWGMKYKSLFEGRRQILDFVLPGEPLGFLDEQRAPYSIEMLTAAEAIAIPRAVFEAQLGIDPQFAVAVCRQLEAGAVRAHERMTSIGHRAARTRVCRLLVELVERTLPAERRAGRIECSLPLTQRHIADATVLCVETVCRMLAQLHAEGLATMRRGVVRIPDFARLQEAC